MAPRKVRPTQARLRELFSYDPETGVFVRKSGIQRGPTDRKYGRIGAGRISELGYVLLMVDGVNYIAGQVAWAYVTGEWPKARIKYIDGNKLNNRIINIRIQGRDREEVKEAPLTHERLKELLAYDPESGWFTWRVHNSNGKPGGRAGGIHGLGYRHIGLEYKKYLEHTLAFFYMTGEWPSLQIDHINGNKSDNRWANLREATRSQNGHNKPLHPRSSTGFPGVIVHGSKYRSELTVNSESFWFGLFKTIAEARIARLLGEKKHLGVFTTFDPVRDGALPYGDNIISLIAGAGRLFVLEGDEPPREIVDVSDLNRVNSEPPED